MLILTHPGGGNWLWCCMYGVVLYMEIEDVNGWIVSKSGRGCVAVRQCYF